MPVLFQLSLAEGNSAEHGPKDARTTGNCPLDSGPLCLHIVPISQIAFEGLVVLNGQPGLCFFISKEIPMSAAIRAGP